jgi:hypothetical protein
MKPSLSVIAFGAAVLALTACSSSVTSEKISQIKPAMKPAEVEAILGQPTSIDHAETTGLTGDLYHYPTPNGEGRVVFLNDAVFKAEFVPTGGKS